MGDAALAVEIREDSGKGVARKLRAAGRIPAVLYGQGKEPVRLSLDPTVLAQVLTKAGHNALIDLQGGSVSGRTVLVKDFQRDPIRGQYLHADFFEINVDQMITVSVSLHLVGESIGVTLDGGLLDHALREVEVDCLPGAIPESIDVDVSGLHLGDSIHVSDLTPPEGVEIKTHGELSIVSVVAPKAEEEVAVVEAVEGEEEGEGDKGDAEDASEKDGEDKPAEG